MTKEREAESCVAADAIQAVFGACLDLSDGIATQVGELAGFEVAKDLLGRIELRRVARQAFDGQRFHPKRWRSTGVCPLGAQVARTDGNRETPDSSSNTISACWRRALFSGTASAA